MDNDSAKISCGPICFALQYRGLDGGAPHGQGAGGRGGNHPHYHYGPMNKNERIYWDTMLVPDPFKWTLDQFKTGKLPAMLTRAGYPTVAAALDEGLIAGRLPEVEARAHAMLQA